MKNTKLRFALLLAILAGSFFALGFTVSDPAVLRDRENINRTLARLFALHPGAHFYFLGKADAYGEMRPEAYPATAALPNFESEDR